MKAIRLYALVALAMLGQSGYTQEEVSAQARDPLLINTDYAQLAYFKAFNTDADDEFGAAVAVDGDTVVVGAPFEDSSSTGINGAGDNNGLLQSGAVFVLVRDHSGLWTQEAYIKAPNTASGDWFGYSVALSGDTLAVGAPLTNGKGAVYVYVREGGLWSLQAQLQPSSLDASDQFGSAVALSADTLVVGVPLEDSNASGVNGDDTDNSLVDAGAAYVFLRDALGNWSEQAYLKASNSGMGDGFGIAVDIDGDIAVIGAYHEDGNAAGVGGDGSDNSFSNAGAAYVFVRDGLGNWSEQAYLKASNTGVSDTFGNAVAVSTDRILVGAAREDSAATGIDGQQADNTAADAGAVYVFARTGNNWAQEAYLKASNTDAGDLFGWSVDLSGNLAVVGARYEASDDGMVNGNQNSNLAPGAGAVYVFARDNNGNWQQQGYLKAANAESYDLLGGAVATDGRSILAGARGEDSSATVTNGNDQDNSVSNGGAAYLFARDGIFADSFE